MRLVTLLARHPDTARPETHALRALMLLHAARFPGRVDGGALRLLAAQDRRAWDGVLLAEGMRALDRAPAARSRAGSTSRRRLPPRTPPRPTWAATNWPHILSLYDALVARWPSPVAALNRVIALAQVAGAEAALAAAERLADDPRLARYHLLPAVLGRSSRTSGQPRASRGTSRRRARASDVRAGAAPPPDAGGIGAL